jgi:hypothetical protein
VSDKAPKEKVQLEPVPSKPEFFGWLESLFNGPTEFPERIEVRIVSGKHGEKMGPSIRQIPFVPQLEVSEKGDKVKKTRNARPSREDLISLSNEIISITQHDCDSSQRATMYAVQAWHFLRSDEPYSRWLMRQSPKAVHKMANGEDGEDDEDGDDSPKKKFSSQVFRHGEAMFQLYGGALEGVVDRQDRALERESQTNERLRQSNERLLDMVEKLQSQQHQRTLDQQWNELKIRSVEKGLDLAIGIAPPLLNQLAGKKASLGEASAESITLKAFFKPVSEGGKLTDEQAKLAFGVYDETPQRNLKEAGALTEAQSKLLWDVAHGTASTDELDRLLPGGTMAVEMAQMIKLQQIFPPEQIAPIVMLIGLRMQNREAQQSQARQ